MAIHRTSPGKRIPIVTLLIWAATFSAAPMHAQTPMPQTAELPSTSTDLFVMIGYTYNW